MRNFRDDAILKLNVVGGSSVTDCMIEALELCVSTKWDVEFVHNNRILLVRFCDLMNQFTMSNITSEVPRPCDTPTSHKTPTSSVNESS